MNRLRCVLTVMIGLALVGSVYSGFHVYRLIFPIVSLGEVQSVAPTWRDKKWFMVDLKEEQFLIDRNGNRAPFDRAGYFSEGLAAYRDGDLGLYGYMNNAGETVISPTFYRAETFHSGMAAVQFLLNGPWTYVDTSGVLLETSDEYRYVQPFYGSFALVHTEEKELIIDRLGKTLVELESRAGRIVYGNGYIAYYSYPADGVEQKLMLLNPHTGSQVELDPAFPFYHAYPLTHNRLLWVTSDRSYEDRSDCLVTDLQLNQLGPVLYNVNGWAPGEEALYVAKKEPNGQYGYINADAEFIIKPQFDIANRFAGGLAYVKNAEEGFYINLQGERAFDMSSNRHGSSFESGLARVYTGRDDSTFQNGDEFVYIDRQGVVVWRCGLTE